MLENHPVAIAVTLAGLAQFAIIIYLIGRVLRWRELTEGYLNPLELPTDSYTAVCKLPSKFGDQWLMAGDKGGFFAVCFIKVEFHERFTVKFGKMIIT